jgi:hypothetical protein
MINRQPSHDIRAVNSALKSYRESIGKPTQRHHYINEARLIHYSLTGLNQLSNVIKPANRVKRKLLAEVLSINRQLISKGVDYQLRKQVCRQVVENQKSKSST